MISELWTFQTYEHPRSEGFVTLRFYCTVNQLVSAGLISPDLMDILVAPGNDAVVMKKWTKRITGERDLTAGEYADMLREDKWRKEKIEKQKQKRKAERERNKKEREEQQKAGKGRGCGRGRGIQVLILMLVNKMVVLVSNMMDLVHLLADLVIAGRFRHAIAVIVVTAKGMMVLFALFARIMNQKVLPPVWSFGSTVMTVEAGYTMCVPLE